jgi:CRISPR-associated protein Cmr2
MTPTGYVDVLDELRKKTRVAEGPLSLLSFTIAGVQSFLDSARTTRDVWNGSYLLSYLVWKATERGLSEIINRASLSSPAETAAFVLLPAIEKQPFWQHWTNGAPTVSSVANFPNAVLLMAPGDEKAADEIAAAMVQAVKETWANICAECRKPLRHFLDGCKAGSLWDYQLGWRERPKERPWQQIFEIYTSVVRLPEDREFDQLAARLGLDCGRGPAGQLIELAMRSLAARKSLRDFEQYVHEGLRCSLCGSRTALPGTSSAGDLREFWEAVRADRALRYTFRDGERLCAVCTVRRLAPLQYFVGVFPSIRPSIFFPSTSTIATAAWGREVIELAKTQREVQQAVRDFTNQLRDWRKQLNIDDPPEALLPAFDSAPDELKPFAQCDGRWFYPETYAPGQLRRDFGVDPERARGLHPPLPALTRALQEKGVGLPDDYIGVLMADGDRMGDWLSGRLDPQRFSLDWQRRFSGCLADFAETVRRRLETEIPGKLVYAGGDDVLAFVPRQCVLQALDILDSSFHNLVRHRLGYRRQDPVSPTLSAACILMKHNEPLRGAMLRCHELLKKVAKRRLGRNAFVVYRTTEGVEAGAPFYAGGCRLLEPLLNLAQAMRHELSPRLLGDLDRLQEGLEDWRDDGALREARSVLIERAFARHYHGPGNSPHATALRSGALLLFQALVAWSQGVGPESVDPYRALLHLLGLLRFLARHR